MIPLRDDAALAKWRAAAAVYADARLWRIFGLGIASGFPWVMIGSAMTAWLSEEGLTRSSIGFFGLIFVAYSVNFLWAPLLDRVRLPVLGRLVGQRRSWILLTQLLVALCCFVIAGISPSSQLEHAKFVALMLALAAATQDIAIDAFRIDTFLSGDSQRVSAASAMATMGWWTGFAGLGALPFILVDLDAWIWADMYELMAFMMLSLMLVPLFSREPETQRDAQHFAKMHEVLLQIQHTGLSRSILPLLAIVSCLGVFSMLVFEWASMAPALEWVLVVFAIVLLTYAVHALMSLGNIAVPDVVRERSPVLRRVQSMVAWLLVSFVEPMAEFFRRNGVGFALSILLFIFLFKIGESFLGRMSIVFYKEVGFSNTDIALYSKLVSWWVTIVFALLGSLINIRYGILRGLFIGGIAMSASNLMFALLAMVGPDKSLLLAAVLVDGFTSAWATVAFVAFLSILCNQAFTASQYALLASIGTLGRTFMASYSGVMVDQLEGNWVMFFLLTTFMVVPSLLLLYRIRHRLRAISDSI